MSDDLDAVMANRPSHVYCQQVIGQGTWCQRAAVASDPRAPAHSSLCQRHLDEVQALQREAEATDG